MTAKWEVSLKQIDKKRTQENFLGQIRRFVQKLVTKVPEQLQQSESLTQQVTSQKMVENEVKKYTEIGICPICKQGQIVDKGDFYGCAVSTIKLISLANLHCLRNGAIKSLLKR